MIRLPAPDYRADAKLPLEIPDGIPAVAAGESLMTTSSVAQDSKLSGKVALPAANVTPLKVWIWPECASQLCA